MSPALLAEIDQLERDELPAVLARVIERLAVAPAPDRALRAPEAARMLGWKVRTLYARQKSLPFTLKGSIPLTFSERGIQRWLATRQG